MPVINFRYSQLTLAGKILVPMLSIFLGIWTAGTLSVGYFATRRQIYDLTQETQSSSTQIASKFDTAQKLLTLKAKSIADMPELSATVAIKDQAALLRTLLPLRSNLELDFIKIIDNQGETLSELSSPTVEIERIQDVKVSQLAQQGLYVSTFVIVEKGSPLLVKTIAIKSRQDKVGSLIVGYALTPEALANTLSTQRQQIVLITDSELITTTLSLSGSSDLTDNFVKDLAALSALDTETAPASLKQSLRKITQPLQMEGKDYLGQPIELPQISEDKFQAIVLTALEPFQSSQQQLWLLIGGFGTIGGLLISGSGLWITKRITRRITYLTEATEKIADGELGVRISVVGSDEVATLANSFNHMTEQLNNRNRKIEKQVAELERLVIALRKLPEQVHAQKMSGLGQMVGGVAHEINNPIGFIYSNIGPAKRYVQDLLELIHLYKAACPNPPEAIQEHSAYLDIDFIEQDTLNLFSSMQSGAKRIREIVLSLRNFARKDEATMKEVNIHDGIESTLGIVSHRLQASPHRPAITITKAYESVPRILCFAGEINQVLTNVLNNAIEALEEKLNQHPGMTFHPTIHIQTHASEDGGATIAIQDNGCGISEEASGKIFDPFFTTKTVGKGVGIGLSIAYQIVVEKHHGKIWVESEQAEGTTVVIQLPSSPRPVMSRPAAALTVA